MLSILIPTYNYNVFPLAKSLEKQAVDLKIPFEIICRDDGSNSALNKENENINQLTNSKFIEAETNKGLSTNRNEMADASLYDYLLFIDGDSVIIDTNYLKNYVDAIKDNPDVVYGGRVHPKDVETTRKLRWKYGITHEDTKASERIKNEYACTLFNNTVIKKEVFNTIYFEKDISEYGHEDTLFAYQLSLIKANVIHIENPVLHGDVDFNDVFFRKTHNSIKNLNYIYTKNIIDTDFVKFLKVFSKLKKYRLHYILSLAHKILYPLFSLNLKSNKPSLFVFNMFRLTYFCHINLKT